MAAQRVAEYSVLFELARGGVARVLIAQRDGATETCVIKVLHPELERRENVVRRFRREARLASLLAHPNIARVVGAGFEPPQLHIAYELIHGETLEAMALALRERGDALPLEAAWAIARGILEGLAYAHERTGEDGESLQVVHRDLSGRNVMVSYQGEVKIIDFGIARGDADSFQTEPGMLVGTLRYLSPEQATGTPVTQASDIYCVSALLYELLSGAPLVPEQSAPDMLHYIAEHVPEPLHRVARHVPPRIAEVIMRGLEKDPSARWSTCREMKEAFSEAAKGSFGIDEGGALLRALMTDLFAGDSDRLLARIREAQHAAVMPSFSTSASDVTLRTRTGVVESLFPTETTLVKEDPAGESTAILERTVALSPTAVVAPPKRGNFIGFVVVACAIVVVLVALASRTPQEMDATRLGEAAPSAIAEPSLPGAVPVPRLAPSPSIEREPPPRIVAIDDPAGAQRSTRSNESKTPAARRPIASAAPPATAVAPPELSAERSATTVRASRELRRLLRAIEEDPTQAGHQRALIARAKERLAEPDLRSNLAARALIGRLQRQPELETFTELVTLIEQSERD